MLSHRLLRSFASLNVLMIALVAAPAASVPAAAAATLEAKRVWSYPHSQSQAPGQKSEIVAYDDRTDTLWVAGVAGVDVLSRAFGQLIAHIDVKPFGAVNSVAIKNGLAGFAIEATPDRTKPGVVVFFDTRTRRQSGSPVAVGALPDMLTFSPDGRFVIVANEATPNQRFAGQPCPVDPPGSVSLIDMGPPDGAPANATRQATTLPLTTVIPGYAALRLFPAKGNGTTRPDMCPYDPEPEYIAVDAASRKAFVGLQEANGVAVIDLASRRFERIFGLGLKDFSLAANSIDPNDRDNAIALQQAPVKGLYQPDGIAAYEFAGRTYLVTANEGDARDNGPGDSEDERRGAAGNASIEYVPDSSPLARLIMSNVESSRGNLVAFGGRSFSIRDADGRIVFDSGNQLDAEAIRRSIYDDTRSDNKGVEPEGVALLRVKGRVLAFIGLERTLKSAIAVYDVTDPAKARFLDMIVSDGDVSPEGLTAFQVGGRSFVAVANEVTDTTSLFEIDLRGVSADQ